MSKLTAIELFSGIGAQSAGLDRAGVDYKIVATAEVEKEATLSYAAVHNKLSEVEQSGYQYPGLQEMADFLAVRNIGYNFKTNTSYNWSKLANSKSKRSHKSLSRYYLASKLVNNLGDISKIEKLPYADFWTYSFPCQDISTSGKLAGIAKGTRSGLLYEVERLLEVAEAEGTLPKYLMLENVKNLVGKSFKKQFELWVKKLDTLGYKTYWKVLNARGYGVPQNRERVIAISVKREVSVADFVFPEPFDNGVRLEDLLETTVDEKYFLNEAQVKRLSDNSYVTSNLRLQQGISRTLCARDYKDPKCVMVHKVSMCAIRGRNPENPTSRWAGQPTKQMLEVSKNGDISNCLTSVQKDSLLLLQGVDGDYRVRKMLPLECWRLMGFNDVDFYKAQEYVSDISLYKQAGNSIVVDMLYHIFKILFVEYIN